MSISHLLGKVLFFIELVNGITHIYYVFAYFFYSIHLEESCVKISSEKLYLFLSASGYILGGYISVSIVSY